MKENIVKREVTRIARSRGRVPFGFEPDPEDSSMIKSIPEHLEILDEIKELVSSKVLSLREGSAWIYEKTGRSLSYQGLKDKIDYGN